MITFINDHTVRLEPDAPRRITRKPPVKRYPHWLEREIAASIKSTIKKEIRGQLWLERQLKKSADYQRALEKRAILKTTGLPGYVCAPYCKVMRTPDQMRGGGRW